MFKNILESIITSEFDHKFGRNSEPAGKFLSAKDQAMELEFSLHSYFDAEEGYRHLKILIFGGGSNYISVFAKLDWTVAPVNTGDEDADLEYTKGETPWLLLCNHDSCWRGAVGDILWEYRDRLATIQTLFNGPSNSWYKKIWVGDAYEKELEDIRRNTPGYGNNNGKRVYPRDLEFRFPGTDAETKEVHGY